MLRRVPLRVPGLRVEASFKGYFQGSLTEFYKGTKQGSAKAATRVLDGFLKFSQSFRNSSKNGVIRVV